MADENTRSDLQRLRWNLALLVALSSIGAALVFASLKMLETASVGQKRAAAQQSEVRSKLSRASEEKIELEQKISLYRSLDQRGVIGQEHRLDWIEQIRRAGESRKLFEVNYELAPQAPVDGSIVSSAGSGFEVLSSPMKFDMPLLHEDDLLNFISDLKAGAQAFLRLRACSLERAPAAENTQGPVPQLKAACELDWITIREKK